MENKSMVSVTQLCLHYQIEMSFFDLLSAHGLIEVVSLKNSLFVHEDNIGDLEKIIRMHRELNVNMEGIDVVLNLLQKIEELQEKLIETENKLSVYSDG